MNVLFTKHERQENIERRLTEAQHMARVNYEMAKRADHDLKTQCLETGAKWDKEATRLQLLAKQF